MRGREQQVVFEGQIPAVEPSLRDETALFPQISGLALVFHSLGDYAQPEGRAHRNDCVDNGKFDCFLSIGYIPDKTLVDP